LNPPPAGSGRDERVLSIPVGSDGPSTLAHSAVCDSQVLAAWQGEPHQAPREDSPLRSPPITLEQRPAPRAQALIDEQLSQRSGGQQSPTALEAGERCHEEMLKQCRAILNSSAGPYSIQRLNRPSLQAMVALAATPQLAWYLARVGWAPASREVGRDRLAQVRAESRSGGPADFTPPRSRCRLRAGLGHGPSAGGA
jgi:hypothetical protein